MTELNPQKLHKMYGRRRPRLAYHRDDFLDYALMLSACEAIVWLCFGPTHPVTLFGAALCIFEIFAFAKRHGVRLRVPLLFRRPQDVFYMILYRIQNLTVWYLLALGLLLLENYVIFLTPDWPHHVGLMRSLAIGLFYLSFGAIFAYRTVILASHLKHRAHVREFLLQTTWKAALVRQPSIGFEIVHAYVSGILAHLLLVTPWYLVITHVNFSVLLLPVTLAIAIVIQGRFLKILPLWFYRDHWLCHNSELEFLYLHGPHHDGIPSGLMGVSGNGPLEGLLRHSLGAPAPFFNPLATFLVYCFEIKGDIEGHQFIPGVYPRIPLSFQQVNQHSTHHYGRLEPYSFGLKLGSGKLPLLPDEINNSIRLDEQIGGFQWDTLRYRQFLALYAKYEALSQAEPVPMVRNDARDSSLTGPS